MQRHYQRGPAQQYCFGGSEGGRDGLMLAQRFPDDFDDIVSVHEAHEAAEQAAPMD